MIKNGFESSKNITATENVCDLKYLTEMMDGNKKLIKGIMDVFLKQVPEELQRINEALARKDYTTIKNFAHTMKSTVSIMGVSSLAPVLQSMEDLAAAILLQSLPPEKASATDNSGDNKIKELNQKLNFICRLALEGIEREKRDYV